MNYTITSADRQLAFSRWLELSVKLLILNDDNSVFDDLTGIANAGTLNIDSSSSVRRTYSITITPSLTDYNLGTRISGWAGRTCLLRLGVRTPRQEQFTWYNQGIFLITGTNLSYDSSSDNLTINCSDLYVTLDGTINGALGAYKTVFPAYAEDSDGSVKDDRYNTIRDSLILAISTFGKIRNYLVCDIGEYRGFREHNTDYQQYRINNPRWNCLPYDLEYSSGSSISSVITDMIELYPGYDAAFDENGTFVVQPVPDCYSDPVIMDDSDINEVLISESISSDLSCVRNVCEVWGRTFDTDFYSEKCSSLDGCYNVEIDNYKTSYYTGDIISFRVDKDNTAAQKVNINGLGIVPVCDENTDNPISACACLAGNVYTFRCRRRYDTDTASFVTMLYLLGQWQPHAVNVLTDGSVIEDGYTAPDGTVLDLYSSEYFETVYNCSNVELTIVPDSPFTVQRIGERCAVMSGQEYDNITSDSLALERARYENWKNSRLTDDITITLNTIILWLKENMKIEYTSRQYNVPSQYITKSVSLDFANGTTTVGMYTFYPLYEDNSESGTYRVLSSYSHARLSRFTHAKLALVKSR